MGAGLAGLVATAELADAGKRVILLDQEPEASLGGQACWSFGGLFLVDSPEQRRLRVHDSLELARQDWLGTAGFDRTEDHWPRQWAEAYLQFAAGEKRAWLKEQGIGFFPVVGWAERGGYTATGPGNSVPRFHIVWGTGPGIVEPFARRVARRGRRAAWSSCASGTGSPSWSSPAERSPACGARCSSPAASPAARPARAPRSDDFEIAAQAVVVTSGGIGGNHDLVRRNWPARLGPAPQRLLSGVPAHVDGQMLEATEAAGASVVNARPDVALHRGHRQPLAGVGAARHPDPARAVVAVARRHRAAAAGAAVPRLRHPRHARAHRADRPRAHLVRRHPQDRREGVRAVGLRAEPRPDRQGRASCCSTGRGPAWPRPVQAFLDRGEDFVVAPTLPELVAGMNRITGGTPELDLAQIEREIVARDREIEHPFTKDLQITAIRGARNYLGDKLIRVAPPHRLLDPEAGPLIAVRLNLLTRKTLGGLETDLSGRVLRARRRGLPRPVRGRRGRRLRRRRHARLPLAGGHLPRRLPVLRADGGPRAGGGAVTTARSLGRSRRRRPSRAAPTQGPPPTGAAAVRLPAPYG